MTTQPVVQFAADGSATLQAFADFALLLPDELSSDDLRSALQALDSRRNHILGWFEQIFQAMSGRKLAFVAAYPPSTALAELARRQQVELVGVTHAQLPDFSWGRAEAFPLVNPGS
jgi:hypothetical protein